MRSSTVGSCCSAGRYSLLMIDGGTFQVGLMVMYFIVSLSSGVALAGLPTTTFVVQSCVVSYNTCLAEVARIPVPAFHVGDHDIGLVAARRAIEVLDGPRVEIAGDR